MRMYHGSVNQRYVGSISDGLAAGALIVAPAGDSVIVACDSTDAKAVERLAAITRLNLRRDDLTVYCADISQAALHLRIDDTDFALIKDSAPGPARFELPVCGPLARQIKARRTCGAVIPDDDITRAVAGALGHPLLGVTARWDDSDLDQTNTEAVAEYYGHGNIDFTIVC